jgi:lysophospholipase L1-like esterase
MRVLVIGGSNSVSLSGYVGFIKTHYETTTGKELDLINVSVGGGSTLSGTGRLLETVKQVGGCDVILYEYGVNDALTYRQADDAQAYFRLSLQMFLQAAAEHYPNARFVPVTLTHQHWYSPNAPEPVRQERDRLYSALGIEQIDVAEWIFRVFEGQMPNFLYADGAHYQRPSMCHLIGSFVAERLRLFIETWRCPSVRELVARFKQLPDWRPVRVRYHTARELQQAAGGKGELMQFSNSLMSVEVLRLLSGSTLAFEACMPALMTFKSDPDHGYLRSKFGGRTVDFSAVYDGIGKLPWVYWSVSIPICASIPINEVLHIAPGYQASFEVNKEINEGSVFQFYQEPVGPGTLLDIMGILSISDADAGDDCKIEIR